MKYCNDRRPCGGDRPPCRPPSPCRPDHPDIPPPRPCPPQALPCRPGGYLMQHVLASGSLHRRQGCYPLCLRSLPDQACPPYTPEDAAVCAAPQWEEADCCGRQGLTLCVTVPLLLRLRDARGCLYSVQTFLQDTLRLLPRGPAADCWRGQVFVQAAARLAGRNSIGCGGACQVPLEVILQGFVLAPCVLDPCAAPPCPPQKPWYPPPIFDHLWDR